MSWYESRHYFLIHVFLSAEKEKKMWFYKAVWNFPQQIALFCFKGISGPDFSNAIFNNSLLESFIYRVLFSLPNFGGLIVSYFLVLFIDQHFILKIQIW